MSPVCSNCGASDFVWANDLKTGSIGGGTLSLRSRGELSLGTRICRACGHADLFLKDPSVLRMPHTWKPGEFVPIPSRPHPGTDNRAPAAAPVPPSPAAAPEGPAAPPPSPPPPPAPVAAPPEPLPSPSSPAEATEAPAEPASETSAPTAESPAPARRGGRRRSSRPKSSGSDEN